VFLVIPPQTNFCGEQIDVAVHELIVRGTVNGMAALARPGASAALY
jgi:hypothetical protein